MKVVLLESLGISEKRLSELEEPFLKKGIEFTACSRSSDPVEILKETEGADVLIVANMPLGDEILKKTNGIKFIDVAFTGVDHIGLNTCREKHIAVSNASGYSTEAVSELALGTVLSMYRRLRQNEDLLRAGKSREEICGSELYGKTAGIIGLGKIGMRTAELLHAFNCRIIASRRHSSDVPEWIALKTNDEILKEADIVFLHCPLNDETRGMINTEKLNLMKPSALLVNMARGPVVNTDDLVKALNSHIIAGAISDVFDTEPPLSAEAPVLHAPNTLLTPHIGYATKEAMELRGRIVFDNLDAWLSGRQKNIILE